MFQVDCLLNQPSGTWRFTVSKCKDFVFGAPCLGVKVFNFTDVRFAFGIQGVSLPSTLRSQSTFLQLQPSETLNPKLQSLNPYSPP